MDYVYRLKSRVKDEGIINALIYIIYLCCKCPVDFFYETFLDLRYSGRLLSGNHKTSYKHLGANDVYHTSYSVMPLIFKFVEISPQDVLVDVGCGKGRVINYWLSRRYTNQIVGLELDPKIAMQTISQFSKYDNVNIFVGDAVEKLPDNGTIFYFYNPFCEEKVIQFEKRLAQMSANRPITIIYYNPKSVHLFNKTTWDIKLINFERDFGIRRWGRFNKYHDLAIIIRKQGAANSET